MSSRRALQLGPGLELPVEVVTQALAILAKRRAGKSYLARRLAEQLFHAGQQLVIVDPKGDWWGIRAAADGRGPGLPVVILGGERGDVPLEAGGGELAAKLVVEERVSCLLDLSLLRKHEVSTFMAPFLEQLYRMKAREAYRTPLMLMIDEADAIAPQKPMKGIQERMLGAAEDIVRRGGQRGIGCGLITQRSAVLNKNVLTQVQVLIALRTIAPQDLKAMDAWIEVHGSDEERERLMDSLPALPIGDAWFWSPGWPSAEGIFRRIHVAPIETFDSGATPKPGEKRVEPKNVADVDLDALRRQMAGTIERAKQDDPRELRRRIAELEKQLKAKMPAAPAKTKVERVEVPVIPPAQQQALERVSRECAHLSRAINQAVERLRLTPAPKPGSTIGFAELAPRRPGAARPPSAAHAGARPAVAPRSSASTNGRSEVGEGERKVLTTIATHEGLRREQLTIWTGYKKSTRNAYLSRLMAKGLVDETAGILSLTEAGQAEGPFEALPRGAELRAHYQTTLPAGEVAVLQLLCEDYPRLFTRDEISEQSGFKKSTRNAYLSRLIRRGLVVQNAGGDLCAAEELFA